MNNSWNAICMFSNLPICVDTEVYAFLIVGMPHEGSFYSSLHWVPIAMFSGKYNGYGSLKEIDKEDIHRLLLQELGLDKPNTSFTLYNIESKRLVSGNCRLPVAMVMMRKDILDSMLCEFSACYSDLEDEIHIAYKRFLECRDELVNHLNNNAKDAPFLTDTMYCNVTNAFDTFYGMYGMTWEPFSLKIKKMCVDHVELAEDILTMNMITAMMETMRKTWYRPADTQNPSIDVDLNRILCKKLISEFDFIDMVPDTYKT